MQFYLSSRKIALSLSLSHFTFIRSLSIYENLISLCLKYVQHSIYYFSLIDLTIRVLTATFSSIEEGHKRLIICTSVYEQAYIDVSGVEMH